MRSVRSTPVSNDSSSSSSSSEFTLSCAASAARVSHLRGALFNPKTITRTCSLTLLPEEVLRLAGSYLEDKDKSLIKFARTSKSTYQALYPAIKHALVKALKKMVVDDDTIQARGLIACHPYLQLRIDERDPTGRAYAGMATTPYQDALADPMAEEMRGVLEVGFPGETREEKRSHAALQSGEFTGSRFATLRAEKQGWLQLTRFAYGVWHDRFQAWEASGYAGAQLPPLRDAWMRVSLAQRQWPKRLRKIFSTVSMDEKQTFEDLPIDLPEPHFGSNEGDRWHSDRIGCNLCLLAVPAERDLRTAAFQAELGRISRGHPVLVQQGKGGTASHYLYAPCISLDRNESEWRSVLIDDPKVQQLIRFGRQTTGSVVAAVDFHQGELPYSPLLEDLYKFGCDRSLHLGVGYSHPFAVYNSFQSLFPVKGAGRAGQAGAAAIGVAIANFRAVDTLFRIRTKRLANYRVDLEQFLTPPKSGLRKY